MKLLFYMWGSNSEPMIRENFIKMGMEMIQCEKPCKHYSKDMELAWELISTVKQQKCDAIFSVNYYPILSLVCDTCKIPYYSWVYDNPHYTLFHESVYLDCNRIFLFDKNLLSYYRNKNIKTMHYMPLGADIVFFEKAKKECVNADKYSSDISFVGSLYTGEYNYYDQIDWDKTSQEKDFFEKIIQKGSFLFGEDYLNYYDLLSKEDGINQRMNNLKYITKLDLGEEYKVDDYTFMMSSVLEKKMTVIERGEFIKELSEKPYDFKLYTNSDCSLFSEKVQSVNQKTVQYHLEMPCVFEKSRINLNLSLKSIHSGIPLRVMDILACNGFVLSNVQTEMMELFVPGKEIEVFSSKEECMDKIDFYLSHEKSREKIAALGYEKVKKCFSYEKLLKKMLDESFC